MVVGKGGAVGRQHEPVVGVPAQVPDGSPSRGAAALPVAGRHGQHDLHALAGSDPLECPVHQVQVTGLHLLAVCEDGSEGARGSVHGQFALNPGQLHPQVR